ncbi:MAG: hypothetical protein ACRELG_20050, partial [Gemmataceae bacterium]
FANARDSIPSVSTLVQAHCCLRLADCRIAISLGRRIRLCAAQLKMNSPSSFSSPRSFGLPDVNGMVRRLIDLA